METNEILNLFDKFEHSSLTELAIKKGDMEVVMKKGGALLQQPALGVEPHPQPQHHIIHAEKTTQPAKEAPGHDIIASPMVATFYRAPAPDAPPFVEIGQKVRKGQTLCVLEAMKLMNELEADFDCEIIKILVENGKMVEYGTPLFEVKKL